MGAEDDFVQLRPSANTRASRLTSEFLDLDAQWSYRSKRQFNMKIRRNGIRHPETLQPIQDVPLAKITERLTALSRIKQYCPRIRKSQHPIAIETEKAVRIQPPEVPMISPSEELHHSLLDREAFKRIWSVPRTRWTWDDNHRALFWQTDASVRLFIENAIKGLEASIARTERIRKMNSLVRPIVQVDGEMIKQYFLQNPMEPILPLAPLPNTATVGQTFPGSEPPKSPHAPLSNSATLDKEIAELLDDSNSPETKP
jgi:hypothetical protein